MVPITIVNALAIYRSKYKRIWWTRLCL